MMEVQSINIEEFLQMREQLPVMDVRSPGEFNHAHIPGAFSLPLFTDEERQVVGTTYKQKSRELAIKAGVEFFKMRPMIEEAEKIMLSNPIGQTGEKKAVIVHCWRGGMRSAAVSWLLNLYGFKVYLLSGGYKSFRKWALEQFEQHLPFQILGGYTGSGKTLLLQELKNCGQQVLDLEQIACHKGSAFGSLGQPSQPTQEMFENLLSLKLHSFRRDECIWVEDESQRIGKLNIPHPMWKAMRDCPVFFIDIPFTERLEYIIKDYGGFDKNKMIEAVLRIQKRLGPKETKDAIGFLLEGNTKAAFTILLNYYDKLYSKALLNRNNAEEKINKLTCSNVDTIVNTSKLLSCVKKPA